jgi:hypothetical protein
MSHACPWTFRFGAGAAACAASQETFLHPLVSASSATERIARHLRVSSIGRTCAPSFRAEHVTPEALDDAVYITASDFRHRSRIDGTPVAGHAACMDAGFAAHGISVGPALDNERQPAVPVSRFYISGRTRLPARAKHLRPISGVAAVVMEAAEPRVRAVCGSTRLKLDFVINLQMAKADRRRC